MRTVLVVDDFKASRNIIRKILEKSGYKIKEAENGKEALSQLQNGRVDLIITDDQMPEMSGFELAKYIRNSSYHEFLPIIMLTTKLTPQKEEDGKEFRIASWIKKPFNTKDLLETVKRILR